MNIFAASFDLDAVIQNYDKSVLNALRVYFMSHKNIPKDEQSRPRRATCALAVYRILISLWFSILLCGFHPQGLLIVQDGGWRCPYIVHQAVRWLKEMW